MPSQNSYHGYVKLPRKQLYYEDIRFDFNCRIDSEPGDTHLRDFAMRMFVLGGSSEKEQPEIAVTLSAEQWLDLIDAMRREYELSHELRKKLEDLNPPA